MVVSTIMQCVAMSWRYQHGRWKEIILFLVGGAGATGLISRNIWEFSLIEVGLSQMLTMRCLFIKSWLFF